MRGDDPLGATRRTNSGTGLRLSQTKMWKLPMGAMLVPHRSTRHSNCYDDSHGRGRPASCGVKWERALGLPEGSKICRAIHSDSENEAEPLAQ